MVTDHQVQLTGVMLDLPHVVEEQFSHCQIPAFEEARGRERVIGHGFDSQFAFCGCVRKVDEKFFLRIDPCGLFIGFEFRESEGLWGREFLVGTGGVVVEVEDGVVGAVPAVVPKVVGAGRV